MFEPLVSFVSTVYNGTLNLMFIERHRKKIQYHKLLLQTAALKMRCCTECSRLTCWQQWRFWCTPLVAVLYLVILLVFLPVLIYDLYKEETGDHFKAWFVAGIFLLLTLPVFLVGLMLHLFNYTQPHLQKHIIR